MLVLARRPSNSISTSSWPFDFMEVSFAASNCSTRSRKSLIRWTFNALRTRNSRAEDPATNVSTPLSGVPVMEMVDFGWHTATTRSVHGYLPSPSRREHSQCASFRSALDLSTCISIQNDPSYCIYCRFCTWLGRIAPTDETDTRNGYICYPLCLLHPALAALISLVFLLDYFCDSSLVELWIVVGSRLLASTDI